MKPPLPSDQKDTKSLRRWVIGGFLVVPLLCCGGTALFLRRWVDMFDYSADLNHQIAEAKRRGMPMEAKDLKLNPPISDRDNAYVDIKHALDAGKKKSNVNNVVAKFQPAKGQSIPPEIAETVKMMETILSKPKYDKNSDFDLCYFILYPEYDFLRTGWRCLSKAAIQEALDGKLDASIRHIQLIEKISGLLSHERQLIGSLVSFSADSACVTTCLKASQSQQANPTYIAQIKAILASGAPIPDIREAYKGEFYTGIVMCRNFEELGGIKALANPEKATMPKEIVRTGVPRSVMAKGMMSSFIKHMNAGEDILEKEKNMSKVGKQLDVYFASIPLTVSNSLVQILAPIWGSACTAWEKRKLSHRLALKAIELMELKRIGKLPYEIEDIPDTLSEGSIVYARTQDGFMIYSKGPNGLDNDGPRNSKTRKKSDDFGFEYPFNAH